MRSRRAFSILPGAAVIARVFLRAALLMAVGCLDPEVRFLDATADAGANRDDAGERRDGGSTVACRSGLGDCDGNPTNGCEASFTDDAMNCGGCGVQCEKGSCEEGRCRSGEWVDIWPCETDFVQVRDIVVDDADRLIALGFLGEECAPLGESPRGSSDWGIARYRAQEGARDSDWVARYGSPLADQPFAIDLSGDRVLAGGDCRNGMEFGDGELESLDGASGCAATFNLNGEVDTKVFVRGDAFEPLQAVALADEGSFALAGVSASQTLTLGGDCPPLEGSPGTEKDPFIARYEEDGDCSWALRVGGGVDSDSVAGLAFDSESNVYLAGTFDGSVSFADAPAVSQRQDVFVSCLSTNGTPQWISILSGLGEDVGTAFVYGGESIFVALTFTDSITIGDEVFAASGSSDALIVRMDADNGDVGWVAHLRGDGFEEVGDLAYDPIRSQVIAVGAFSEEIAGSSFQANGTGFEAWAAIFDAETGAGSNLLTFGGNGTDDVDAVAVDSRGGVYLGGRFQRETIFPNGEEHVGPGAGATAGFVFRWEP